MSLASIVLLAACSSDNSQQAKERNPAPCPSAIVLEEAARQVVFDGEPSLDSIEWSAEIQDLSLTCRYFGDKPINAEIDFSIAVGKGPAAKSDEHEFRYFVAVTRRNREVIAKKTFAKKVDFGSNNSIKVFNESVDDIVIPRAREQISGANFEIVLGLAVTRDQAIYNRSGKSLKFPDLK
ncbi:MAG: hypothetical protein AAF742_06050 [Pseudomonadota bacterium]